MSNVKVTLYHMNGCGHCDRFKPQWKIFVGLVKDGKYDKTKIRKFETADKESNTLDGKIDTINGEQIESFPTIKVKVDNFESQYNGARTAKDLLNYVQSATIQSGGKKDNALFMGIPTLRSSLDGPLLQSPIPNNPFATLLGVQPGAPSLFGMPNMMGNMSSSGCDKCKKYKKKFHKYKKMYAELLKKYKDLKHD